jgi:hypothetical protein
MDTMGTVSAIRMFRDYFTCFAFYFICRFSQPNQNQLMLEPFGTERNWQFLENRHYAGSYNQSRQQSIAFCSFCSQRFGIFDFLIEEFVEVSNQFLWWTLLDDSAHLVSKTY